MNHQSFHAHFFRDEAGAWCISVRLPDGTRTVPRALTPMQIYELLPWLEALGIGYENLVDHGQNIEFWIAETLERLEAQRARMRRLDNWEVVLLWLGIACVLLSMLCLFLGLSDVAMGLAAAYLPVALSRDACAREAAYCHRSLRSIFP